jgi:hypothetical protein
MGLLGVYCLYDKYNTSVGLFGCADENLDNRSERWVEVMLKSEGNTVNEPDMLLSDAIAMVDTPEGHARLKAYLASQPFPHFEAYPGNPRLLVRIEEDGTRTVGNFVERQFVPFHRSSD